VTRFAVETWAPEYGSPSDADIDLVVSEVPVDLAVERDPAAWAPVAPAPGRAPPGVALFVDGVRRIEARVWLTGDDGDVRPGICASYAAGVVRCDATRATVVTARVGRGLFARARPGLTGIPTRHDDFALRATAADDPDTLSLALQEAMKELEFVVAAEAAQGGELVVVDGPLGSRRVLPGTVGYVKTHRVAYLPLELRRVVGALEAGERTPVFCIGDRFARHSWYVRLPGEVAHPWSGVVRCEAAADVTPAEAAEVADELALFLPRFASVEHKDPRAPQNLFPIAGLERELRRRLGDALVVHRNLREAARRTRGAA
jgi:hypothetical protein